MSTTSFRNKIALLITALLAGVASPAQAAEAPTLERGLVQQAPRLIKHFKTNGFKNVGVLKFLVNRQGAKGLSDNVGTLNMLLARRLEIALVLANDPRKPVGIIRNASAVASRTRGANHLKTAGRKKLFGARYPLAWGKAEVKADAFVTGIAQVSKDLRTLTVSLFGFDRVKNKLAQLGKDFNVRVDAGKLAEINESFALRGLFDDGKAVLAAARVKDKEARHPLQQRKLPVQLVVLYDGKRVDIRHEEGKAYLPEPKEGQKVMFRLRRDSGKERYGVVLKVNGENTIRRQRLPDLQCRRWILDPGDRPITIRGFQTDGKSAQAFRVLSRAESKGREMDYGEDVGTISLTVFRERKTEETPDPEEEREQRNTRLVARAKLPEGKESYQALKSELLEEANETRGLIVEGDKVESKVRKVKFTADPTPVMSVTIIYYKP
jgi:hypothetical protein